MSNIVDENRIAQIVYEGVDADFLSKAVNNATLNDVSNLGLNEEEAKAYNNIMSSRNVEKRLEETQITMRVSYDNVNDPGDFLSVLTEGQDAPEITGTVHLPQGGTRPSNVKFFYPGQVYEEGAKEPVVFPENDSRLLESYGHDEVERSASSSKEQISAEVKDSLENYVSNLLKGG